MKDITVTLRDLNPDLQAAIKRDEVPEVPVDAARHQDDYGDHDVVFDYEDQRWRFSGKTKELIAYIVYGGKPRRPIAMWGGNY
jgi:hypothetical protein